jgi:cytochrome b561
MRQPLSQAYDATAKWLHWLVATAIILLLLGGTLFHFMPLEEKVARAASGHAGLGTLVFLIMLFRLYWRYRHPVAVPVMPEWQSRLSKLVHWLLYTCVLLQPIFGVLMAMSSPYDVIAFNLFNYSAFPDETWHRVFHICHRVNGTTLALALFMHVSAVIYHQFVLHDSLLSRMLPRNSGAASSLAKKTTKTSE